MTTLQITDDLDLLLAVLPDRIRELLEQSDRTGDLLEIGMDLGRLPEARFSDGEMVLSKFEITAADLKMVLERVATLEKIIALVSSAHCIAFRQSAIARAR